MNRPPTGRRKKESSSPGGSRIPSPSRKLGASLRSSRASTPQSLRSRSPSPSGISTGRSTPSAENLSPIRPSEKDDTRRVQTPDIGIGKNLVRYITHDLIKKLAKEEDFELIKTLTFNLAGEKKIRYIENLDGLKSLVSLSLSGNVIQKIEKLEHLAQLKSLNLANNQLTKIEGIETMVNLQTLNLEGNRIDKIPIWLPKKLRSLRTLKLANNSLSSLSEIVRLRGLHDLTSFTIANNPLCVLAHHRSYVIFQLKILQQIDNVTVTTKERSEANSRFAQEELDRVTKELMDTVAELESTRENHNRSIEEIDMYSTREREYNDREERSKETRDELERELTAKDDLLRKKNKELQRAQAKNQDLEQELAFMKIDAKFEPLNFRNVEEDDDDENDIPYIGKSRYKRNQMAHEMNLPSSLHQMRLKEEAARRDLDKDLADKQRQLNEAAERLARLQEVLRETQKQIQDAQRELAKLERDKNERMMTEAEKQKMRDNMASKMRKVDQANKDAQTIEDAVKQARDVLQRSRLESDQMKRAMRDMDQNTDDYKEMKSSMDEKEEGMKELADQIGENERKLDRLLKATAIDTEHIKQLENQLEKGMTSQDDALRSELEGVVNGLHDYLRNVRRKADDQRAQFDDLLNDKEKLIRRLAELEEEKAQLESDIDDYNQLQQQLSALNESMAEIQDMNDSLQKETHERSVQNDEMFHELQDARDKINELSKSIQNVEKDRMKKKSSLDQQTDEMKRLKNLLREKAAQTADFQEEIDRLNACNEDLKNEFDSKQDQLNNTLGSMLRPDDIVKRIRRLQKTMQRGDHDSYKSRQEEDEIDGALTSLHDQLMGLVDKENKGKGDAEKKLKDLEKNTDRLKKKLLEAQKEYKETLEAATNAKLEDAKLRHQQDLNAREDELQRLKDKLKQAEEDGKALRKKMEKERMGKEAEERMREERERLLDAKCQATMRDLERELDETKREAKERKDAAAKSSSQTATRSKRCTKNLKNSR